MQHQKTLHHIKPSPVQWASGADEPINHLNVENFRKYREEEFEEPHQQTRTSLQLHKKPKYGVYTILSLIWTKTKFANQVDTVSN